ncbi:MAG: hypothetical protein LBB62_01230 [Proteiniphilum sp.]|jgi:hypothetical protein|nr:hypothetical protein [Proteiniphilum sp.]
MKVKNIFITSGLLTVLFLASCVTDYGNYEYRDAEAVLPVSISGIKDTSIMKGEYLVLEPEVTIKENQENYTYSWYVMPVNYAGALPEKTVWGNTKKLNQQVTLAVGNYYLNFAVRDSVRDIYVRKEVILNIKATEVGAGWFVLKDIDNETDFDYIKNDGTLYPDVLLTLADPAGSRLKGNAVKIEYQPTRYYHQLIDENGKVTQTLSNQSVYHILSDEDIKVFNSKELNLFKNQQDVFYTPTVCRPQNIGYSFSANLFLINDGKISAIYGMMTNIGKLTIKTGFYTFHPDMMVHRSGNAMGFDMDNHTFYHVDAYSDMVTFRTGAIPTTNMDATLINLLSASGVSQYGATTRGLAVMKSLDKDEYYLATLNYNNSNAYPIAVSESDPTRVAFDTIPAGSKFPNASVKAAPFTGNFAYFADGNKLSVYRNAPGLDAKESLMKEFPAGETISYMTNLYKANSFNYLAILTNSSNGWKMYAFNVLGLGNPEFETTPAFTYQGTGNARFLMYRE